MYEITSGHSLLAIIEKPITKASNSINLDTREELLFLTVMLVIAAISDIHFQKIPNWLTYSSALVAVVYHSIMKGIEGVLFSVGGVIVGVSLLITFYLLGGMGAGDVKLMGAVGGFLGAKGVFVVFIFSAIIGVIYAFVLLALHGLLVDTFKRYWIILKTFILTKKIIYVSSHKRKKELKLYYGVAIVMGTLILIFFHKTGI